MPNPSTSVGAFQRPRLVAALALVIVGSGFALLLGATFEVAAVNLVLGAAAMLLLGTEPPNAPERENVVRVEEPFPRALDPVIDAIAEPLLLVVNGRVVRANAAAVALLGRHILNRDLRLAIRHPAVAELLHGRSDSPVELALDGFGRQGERWLLRAAPVGTSGRMIQLVDRTAAHAADRMRVDFVANASHELRTPLAAVLGFVETLQDDETGADREVRQRFLEIIAKEGRRMLRLVEDLLSLSRIEAGRHQAPSAQIDLGALAESVAAVVAGQHGARGDDLVIQRSGDTRVIGNQPELTQLTQNLMANALKYGQIGTPVSVTIACEDEGVTLTVVDHGEGIAAKHLPRLTERFYRVDPGRSRSVGGTGLGLAIVKHIVERHRGRLHISSVVGTGTTVTVHLPQASANRSHEAVTEKQQSPA
jgi:two-component system phosphate regulon sensor histidine kinase PhoR